MSENWKTVSLQTQPGHYARRVHQLAVALFVQEVGALNLTPVQYAALHTVCQQPGIDQKRLAAAIGYDTSTTAGVVDRLEARGLLQRTVSASDRRAKQLTPTPEGLAVLEAVVPAMLRTQERLLEPLTPEQREVFMDLLRRVVDANPELSHKPARE